MKKGAESVQLKRVTKLTEKDIQEIRAVLAEVRRCLQELIAIKKEANQKTELRSQPQR